jgi:UDP-N-acetyl-D-glucosamine dehydrogenase
LSLRRISNCRQSRVHILGVAYKRDIDDVRESPALDIIHLLQRRGAEVTYSDPYVPLVRIDDKELFSKDLNGIVAEADCIAIITDHASIDYAAVVDKARLIVDTRNALKGFSSPKIVRL